jgi:hypothetical protein
MVEDTGAAGEAVQHIALYVTTLKLDFARTCSAISLSSPLSGKVTQIFLGQIIVHSFSATTSFWRPTACTRTFTSYPPF